MEIRHQSLGGILFTSRQFWSPKVVGRRIGRVIAHGLVVAIVAATNVVFAESTISDGILLSFDCRSREAVLTNVSGVAQTGYVVIPERVGDKNVIGIDYMPRGESTGIVELTLPQTLTNFQVQAFSLMRQLENFKVADGNTSFTARDGMLYDAGGTVLLCCPSARQIVAIPEGTDEIAHSAFARSVIEEVTMPDSLLVIGDCGFADCNHLGKVSLPHNLRKIGDGAFRNWQWSGCLVLSKDLEFLGEQVFSQSKLWGFDVEDGNKHFVADDGVLYDITRTRLICCPPCNFFDSVPEGVVSIEPYAVAWFNPDGSLSIDLPDSLQEIGHHAFYNAHITDLDIPAGVTNIGAWAFSGCQGCITVSGQNERYFMDNGLIYEQKSQWDPTRGKNVKTLVVHSFPRTGGNPISVGGIDPRTTEIAEGAFANSVLASISIPPSVGKIGLSGFYQCANLTSITLPNAVTNIGAGAFSICRNLKQVFFEGEKPDVVGVDIYDGTHKDLTTFVGDTAHSWDRDVRQGIWMSRRIERLSSGLETGDIGGSCVSDGVVLNCDCSGDGAVLTNMTGTALTGCIVLPEIVGNKPLVEIGTMTWSCTGILQIAISKTITNIAIRAFAGCRSLETIFVDAENGRYKAIQGVLYDKCATTLLSCPHEMKAHSVPDGVNRIADSAFWGCSIETVQMPEGLQSIGASAFDSCYSMWKCRLPSTVQEIGIGAFYQCWKLSGECTLPSGLKSLGKGAFIRTAIQDFVIDDTNASFKTVDGILFDKQGTTLVLCPPKKRLQSYPEGVLRIGDGAFAWVDSVPRYISDSVLEIGSGAFDFVCSPDVITVGANVTNIGVHAFDSPYIKYIDVSSNNRTFFVRNGILYDRRIPWPWSGVGRLDQIHLVAHSAPYGIEKASLIEGTEEIAEGAFGCGQFSEIIIPGTVKKIGASAFSMCKNLRRVLFLGEKPDVVGTGLYLGSSRELTTFVGDSAHSWDSDVRSGMWMDRRIENCASVLPLGEGGAGVKSVPSELVADWLSSFGEKAMRDFADRYGEDISMSMRLPSGKSDSTGRPMFVWEDYIAGTNPMNPDSRFVATINLVEGEPVVSWTPELEPEQAEIRKYTVYGKNSLADEDWSVVQDDCEKYQFFKVSVEMK